MRPEEQIDKKVKEKLDNFSEVPPQSAWKNIQANLNQAPYGSGSTIAWLHANLWKYVAVAVLTGGIATYVFLFDKSGENPKYQEREQKFTLEKVDKQTITSDRTKIAEKSQQKETSETDMDKQLDARDKEAESSSNRSLTKDKILEKMDKKPVTTKERSTLIAPDKSYIHVKPEQVIREGKIYTKRKNLEVQLSQGKKNFSIPSKILSDSFDLRSDEIFAGKSKLEKMTRPRNSFSDLKQQSKFSLGLYVNTDRIYNIANALKDPAETYGYGIAGRYHLTKSYFLETGLGFYKTEDRWDHIVDYRTHEVVDYYEAVDSISYKIVQSSTGSDSVVVDKYYTHQEPVMDSVDRKNRDISKWSYTYFTLPLKVGYKNNINKFIYSVKTGLLMSLVVHEELKTEKLPNNVHILDVEDKTYRRVGTNWHYTLNIGLGYQISHRWSLMVETNFKMYLEKLYKKNPEDNAGNPYSFGLSTGLYYRF